jgi:hypothetical protein
MDIWGKILDGDFAPMRGLQNKYCIFEYNGLDF